MVQEGVITGYDDGTFRPDNPITLQEVAALALRAVNWPVGEGNAENYTLTSTSDYNAEDKERIRSALNACDDWARPYVKGWIAFNILAEAAKYNGSELGNNIAYDADYNENYATTQNKYGIVTEEEQDKIWGYDMDARSEGQRFYIRRTGFPSGQYACYQAGKHGLVALERTEDVRHSGQTIFSANP